MQEVGSLAYVLGTWNPAVQNDAQQATAFKKALASGTGSLAAYPAPTSFASPPPVAAPGVLTRVFKQVARIKLAPGFNEGIGQSLNVIGAQQSGPDLSSVQPIIVATLNGSRVEIGWSWQGNSAYLDLCELQVDRSDGKGSIPLAFDTTPGYIDTAPWPATPTKWTYKAIYRVGDHQVGQWSAEVSVTVGG